MEILEGMEQLPPRLLVYGKQKIGKSTFANSAPNTIFIDVEKGLARLNCKRRVCATFFDARDALDWLLNEQHPFETVAIDTLDWLERLIWGAMCQAEKVTTIEKVGGGYGKGFTQAVGWWQSVIEQLDALRERRGMTSILLAHCEVKKVTSPGLPSYDQFSPKLHKYAAEVIGEWVDAILFATTRLRIEEEDIGFNKTRNIAKPIGKDGGDRVLRCNQGDPSYLAGNRYGLPSEIPMTWNDFVNNIAT